MRVTTNEAARLLGVSGAMVRRRLHNGDMKGTKMRTPLGVAWMVALPDDLLMDEADSGEIGSLRELVAALKTQTESQQEELEARRREAQILHALLQQAQDQREQQSQVVEDEVRELPEG